MERYAVGFGISSAAVLALIPLSWNHSWEASSIQGSPPGRPAISLVSRYYSGLKIVSYGFLLTVLPKNLTINVQSKFPLNRSGGGETLETSSSAGRSRSSSSRSSGTADKPWLKQLRELAKSSFSAKGSGTPNDPSSSRTKWSGFWNRNRSGSSSKNSSSDFKSKPKGLYKDLEAIFAAK
ncbi:hypothetical protein LWI29_000715 [Acer saccharum]|uniref:Uncharacterized protein n=1 Tax=Acer saccharum TaxID=4024 RepID=A0AA39S604_ACESA|nr:hypothetical protein LWI29_000715 [Acer saccharum]